MSTDLRSQIMAVIREKLGVSAEQVTPAASFTDDLGADSLSLIELTLAFETEFDVDIDVEDVANIQTVAEAIDYVEACVRSRG